MIVFVMGLPRAGTSFVSRLLHEELKINMGSVFLEADSANPDGYFEDATMLEINKWILTEAGGDWKNPPSVRDIAKTKSNSKLSLYMEKVFNEKNKQERWGWKDPRNSLTCWTWDIFFEEQDVRILSITKGDFKITRSLERIHGEFDWHGVLSQYRKSIHAFKSYSGWPFMQLNFTDLLFEETCMTFVDELLGFLQSDYDPDKLFELIQSRKR